MNASLKDVRWQIIGETEIQDMTLLDPIFRVKTVNYNAETMIADVELMFREGVGIYEHSRIFQSQLSQGQENLSADDIALFVEATFPTATRIDGL